MRPVRRLVTVATALAVLAGCAVLEKGRLIAAEGAARAVLLECGLSDQQRRKNLQAINGWLMAEGYAHRATALDCDGDGIPDLQALNLHPSL